MPFLRFLANKVFSNFTSFMLNIKLTEFHTGLSYLVENFMKQFHMNLILILSYLVFKLYLSKII